jgi:acyl-CoA synthetase (AMP-forming)/AMP-acid ligase II/thioester reductase-like protein
VHGGVAARAAEAPDAPAVLTLPPGGGPATCALTRRQLQAAARTLSVRLRRCCRTTDAALTVVAVLLDSTPARLVAYLAVLRAGCVFAPLETTQPRDALAAALAAAAPAALITSADLAAARLPPRDELPGVAVLVLEDATGALLPSDADEAAAAGDDDDAADDAACAATLAHACFTSGTSTGVPRLLACAHGGSLASHAWRTALCPYAADDVTAANVFGIWDAAAALLAGTAVAPLRDALVHGGGALGGALLRCGATRVMLTPTLAAALLRDPLGAAALRALRLLTLCGEPAGAPLLAALREAMRPRAVLLNLYSLSEAHDVAAERISADAVADASAGVTCGFVAPFARVHVLRADGSVAAPGERGAVWLSGAALADGHVTRDGGVDAYAAGGGFADMPLPADCDDDGCSTAMTRVRAFHTGDVGALLRDGRLVVAGRAAGAAKLKLAGGATADAGAIEAAILRRCGARVAACAVAERHGELAAFLVALAAHGVSAQEEDDDADGQGLWRNARWVRDALAGAVPAHALPQRIVWLPTLPLGGTGKLDRAALPWPVEEEQRETGAAGKDDADEADDEARARAMFAAAVRIRVAACSAAVDTHFIMDLGGTSVAAAAMLGSANVAACARGCPPLRLPEFIAEPTLGGLARMLRRQRLCGAEDVHAAAADADEAEAARRDADTLPVAEDAAVPIPTATNADAAAHRACIVLTGAAGTIGAHALCALFSHLEMRPRDDAAAGRITLVCLIRAADDAAAAVRLRAALARHGLPPLPQAWAGVNVAVVALASDLEAPHLGLAGGAAAFASLAAATRAVLHAAGRVSLAAPYASLRGPNVLASAAVMRFAAAAAAPLHVVSSSAALPYDSAVRQQRAAPPGAHPPAGGYSRAKWAVERLAMRAAATAARPDSSGAAVTLHRVGYIACRAGAPGAAALPPDAQGIVLAACAALCAAPVRRGWALSWADLPRFAAALAIEVAADACAMLQAQQQPSAAAGLSPPLCMLRVLHHAGVDAPFEMALLRLRARGLPSRCIDADAWAGAVRAGAGAVTEDATLALQLAAALLDAVGVDAACGAADAQLLRSHWPHDDASRAHDEEELTGDDEGIALLDGVLDALAARGMLPAAGACVLRSPSP